jgi:hypothetical protein
MACYEVNRAFTFTLPVQHNNSPEDYNLSNTRQNPENFQPATGPCTDSLESRPQDYTALLEDPFK